MTPAQAGRVSHRYAILREKEALEKAMTKLRYLGRNTPYLKQVDELIVS